MRRICNIEPSLCLWFFKTIGSLPCLVSIILFCYYFKIMNQCVFTSYNIYKLSLFEFGKHFLAIQWRFVLVPIFGHLSIYAISIWQKSFVHSKIRFKMKCTRDSDKPTSLVISGIVYLLSLSITFIICNCETFALPVTANASKILFFDGLCGSQFLSLSTNSLTIPIRHINFL